VFEAKICKNDRLSFDLVVPHQVTNLLLAKHNILSHKIIDAGYQNPFDGVQLLQVSAYVVVYWYQYRDDKRFTLIDIDEWVKEKETSTKKSLTYERSCEIGQCFEF